MSIIYVISKMSHKFETFLQIPQFSGILSPATVVGYVLIAIWPEVRRRKLIFLEFSKRIIWNGLSENSEFSKKIFLN